MTAFLRSSGCFSASLLPTQFPRVSVPASLGFYLLPAVIVFLTLSPPLFLRLHGDLATLSRVHIDPGSWSPPIPAYGSGTVVPRVKRQRTVEPDPENRWGPGKHGPWASAGLYDTSYTLCCFPNTHPLAVWQALCQHCHVCSSQNPLR